jgi:hypothetical protein
MKSNRVFKATYIVALVLFLASCASLGPVYQKADPPAGKAVIYFYRPYSFVGAAVKYSVWDVTNPIVTKKVTIVYDEGKEYPRIDKYEKGAENASNLATLSPGSYYAYTVNPGTYYFMVGTAGVWQSWGVTDFITKVEAKTGKRYFLHSKVFAGGRSYIETRTVEQGEKEIADCGLVIKENN